MKIDFANLDYTLEMIKLEYMKARDKHGAMHSQHEGYAVILEELDEVWDEVKHDKSAEAKGEMIQVAAMALAFLLET